MENKLIIKTTVTEKKQIEKEISLPYYSTGVNAFYMAISEKQGIRVYINGETGMLWTLSEYEMGEVFQNEPCTEAEFAEAFQNALYQISKHSPLLTYAQYPLPEPGEDYEPELKRDEHFIDLP